MFRKKTSLASECDVKVKINKDVIECITFDVDSEIKSIYLDNLSELSLVQQPNNKNNNFPPTPNTPM